MTQKTEPKRFDHLGFWMTAVPLVLLAMAITAFEAFSAMAWLSWAGFLVVVFAIAWNNAKPASRAEPANR